jgi:hypothetical protein
MQSGREAGQMHGKEVRVLARQGRERLIPPELYLVGLEAEVTFDLAGGVHHRVPLPLAEMSERAPDVLVPTPKVLLQFCVPRVIDLSSQCRWVRPLGPGLHRPDGRRPGDESRPPGILRVNDDVPAAVGHIDPVVVVDVVEGYTAGTGLRDHEGVDEVLEACPAGFGEFVHQVLGVGTHQRLPGAVPRFALVRCCG